VSLGRASTASATGERGESQPVTATQRWLWLFAVALGCAVFSWIGYWPTLNPRSLSWIFHEDPFTHVMGWEHFRNTPLLQYPITKSDLYGLEWSSSVVFSDSIPLVAVLLKPMSGVLPKPFQYLGWWVFATLVLQAYWGAKLVMLRSQRFVDAAVGALLFATAPVLLERAGLQSALGSHWIILCALWLYLSSTAPRHKAWAFVLFLSAGVHAYMLVMSGAVWLAHLVACWRHGTVGKRDLIISASTLVGLIAWMHALGYFMAGAAEGIWRSHFDLGAFAAPSRGVRLDLLPPVRHQAWDGSAYLGGGLLLILLATLAIFAVQRVRKVQVTDREEAARQQVSWVPLLVCVAGFVAFAITNRVTILNHELFSFSLPGFMERIYAVFRGGNRMIWPAYYLAILAIVWAVLRTWPGRTSTFALLAACVVQLIDLDGMAAIKRNEVKGPPLTRPLNDAAWSVIAQHYREIVSVPSTTHQDGWPTISWFAAEHRLGTNVVYVSRYDWPRVAAATRRRSVGWRTGKYDANTAYIFPSEAVWELARHTIGPDDLAVVADGFHLILPGGRKWSSGSSDPPQPRDVPLIGQWISFVDDASTGLMLEGWSWHEWWGTWTDGEHSWLVLPVPANERVRVTFRWTARAPRNMQQAVRVQLGESMFDVTFNDKEEREDTFEVFSPTSLLDVRLRVASPLPRRHVRNYGVKELRSIGVGLKAARVERMPTH
jgi:hypothetical protein